MILKLTDEQTAEIRRHMQPGRVILGRIMWKPFDGDISQCGSLLLDYGFVHEQALDGLREAIREANEPKKAKQGKRSHA